MYELKKAIEAVLKMRQTLLTDGYGQEVEDLDHLKEVYEGENGQPGAKNHL